jgi:hypothetical protein
MESRQGKSIVAIRRRWLGGALTGVLPRIF